MHLDSTKKGFDCEKLAVFILSHFSHVSQPISTPDDIGADFTCTPFERITKNNKERITPVNYAFHIQVKKAPNKGQISNIKVNDHTSRLLCNSWFPFFIGIADYQKLSLTFYSGRHIPLFYTLNGDPFDHWNKIKFLLKENDESDPYSEIDKIHQIVFPKVATLSLNAQGEIQKEWEKIIEEISIIQNKIAERRA